MPKNKSEVDPTPSNMYTLFRSAALSILPAGTVNAVLAPPVSHQQLEGLWKQVEQDSEKTAANLERSDDLSKRAKAILEEIAKEEAKHSPKNSF